MKNEKGFTLVELIVVIAVIGLLLILVVPSLFTIKKQNETKEFEYYETALVESGKLYYDQNRSDILELAGFPGCVDLSYETLLASSLLKPYESEKYQCERTKTGVRVERISEENITYTPFLLCLDKKTGEPVYETAVPSGACVAYQASPSVTP